MPTTPSGRSVKSPRAGHRKTATESVATVVKRGDRRDSLEALRDKLASALDEASPMVIAQIAARLQAVIRELSEMPAGKKVSKADELAGRRKARRATSDVATSADGTVR